MIIATDSRSGSVRIPKRDPPNPLPIAIEYLLPAFRFRSKQAKRGGRLPFGFSQQGIELRPYWAFSFLV